MRWPVNSPITQNYSPGERGSRRRSPPGFGPGGWGGGGQSENFSTMPARVRETILVVHGTDTSSGRRGTAYRDHSPDEDNRITTGFRSDDLRGRTASPRLVRIRRGWGGARENVVEKRGGRRDRAEDRHATAGFLRSSRAPRTGSLAKPDSSLFIRLV